MSILYFLKFITNIDEKESCKSSFKWKWKKWGGGEPRNVSMKDSVFCLSKYRAGRLYLKGGALLISLCWPKNFAQLLPQATTPSDDHTLRDHSLGQPRPQETTPSGDHSLRRSHPPVATPSGNHSLGQLCPQETTPSGDHAPRRLHHLVATPPETTPSGHQVLRRSHPLVAQPSGEHTLRWSRPQETTPSGDPSFRILLAFFFYTWKTPALSITRV